jgi:predicted small metal-binding protein
MVTASHPRIPARLAGHLLDKSSIESHRRMSLDWRTACWRPDVMKILRFNEAGLDCNFEVHGMTVEEVLKKATDHARKGHNLEVTEDSLETWRSLIQED